MGRRVESARDLLFGLLALQNGLVQQSALIGAFGAWTAAKDKSMATVLADQGALDAAQLELLGNLVDAYLKLHGGDAERSLARLNPERSTFEGLERLGDADINASLNHFASRTRGGGEDLEPGATLSYSVGSSTSDGQRFRVLRPHARGGLGEVFVALDTELDREVALKQVLDERADDPVIRQRFVLEAEITGGLEHPNIVPVYGLGSYGDGRPYYAMRFIRGESLKEAIERFHTGDGNAADRGRRSLALRKLIRHFSDLCNAIDYAHSRGVLHRDIKPANVILGKHGETLLVDWGLAKSIGTLDNGIDRDERPLLPRSGADSAETVAGSALGTPAYMSPEQAAGDLARLGPQSDVFSLGATLYCLLTGEPPFKGDNAGSVLRAAQRGEFVPPRVRNPSLHPNLEAVCLKAMAKAPANRFVSARALAEDLEHWMADEPVTARAEPVFAKLARWGRHHKSTVAAAIALLSTAVVALGIGAVLLSAANARTQQERDLARRNFETARGAVDEYLTRVGRNPLLKEQGLHDLRRELLEAALSYYEEFLVQQGEANPVRFAAAAANERVGDIHRELGRFELAVANYDRGLVLLKPAPAVLAPTLARLRMEASRIAALNSLGRFQDAINAYRRAISSIPGIRGPDLNAVLLKLGNAGAEAHARAGLAQQGLQAAQQALAAGEIYAKQHPEDRDALHDLIIAYTNSVRGLHVAALSDEAMRISKRGIEQAENAVRRHPRDIELREGFAELINHVADVEKNNALSALALAHLKQAVSVLEDVCRENPILFRPRLILTDSLGYLSNFQSDFNQIDAARQSAERAVSIALELQQNWPGLPRVGENLGVAQLALGRALARAGNFKEALAALYRGGELMENSGESMYLYNAACALSLASAIDDSLDGASSAERQIRRNRDAARAVALLQKAVDHGLSEPSVPQSDSDIAPIRLRDDFKALIKAMQAADKSKNDGVPKSGAK